MRKHHVHHLANGGALHLMGQILKRSVHKSFSSKQIFEIILYFMDVWYHVQSKGAIIRKYAVMENPSQRTV